MSEAIRKTIAVGAAAILENGRVLLCRRASGEWKGYWEFPGGKVEPGETAAQAVEREIREELCLDVHAKERLCVVEMDYPSFRLTMEVYICRIEGGKMEVLEHEKACFFAPDEIKALRLCPADVQAAQSLLNFFDRDRVQRSVNRGEG